MPLDRREVGGRAEGWAEQGAGGAPAAAALREHQAAQWESGFAVSGEAKVKGFQKLVSMLHFIDVQVLVA